MDSFNKPLNLGGVTPIHLKTNNIIFLMGQKPKKSIPRAGDVTQVI
jgi:hypothetical protein